MRRVPLLFAVLVLSGCGLFSPPRWVQVHPALSDGFVYGVGQSGPTDDGEPTTAEGVARTRSLDDLSWQVRLLAAERLGPSSPNDMLVIPPLLEGELEGAEIVEVWVDTFGDTKGDLRTYALARVPVTRLDAIVTRLGGAHDDGPKAAADAMEEVDLEGADDEVSDDEAGGGAPSDG
ncbi:MAG: hypothetical protein H6825_09750 [Planctomycetes bacterium]|nr:hypothetical protein [Planctomycetota bacterium]